MSHNSATISRPVRQVRRTANLPKGRHEAGRSCIEVEHVAQPCTTTSPAHPDWYRAKADELANTITHGAGLVLSVAGAVLMAAMVWGQGDGWRIAGCAVFLASMMAVYAASTLSHGVTHPVWKNRLRQIDQGVIYLLVVGTYTPFGLTYLRTGPGWLLLAALWIGAIAGFLAKVVFAHRVNNSSVLTYVVLGVLPTIVIPWLWNSVPAGTTIWMAVGGICYLAGTFFLIFDSRVRHFHAVWHLLVIAGSTCHFLAILGAVARAS